jgi:GAF domain-containing protein
MTEELTHADRAALSDAIAAMAGIVLGDGPFETVLAKLTEIAKRTIAGAFEVSVTMENRQPATAARTAAFAEAIDEAQYAAGDGPCLEALRDGLTVVVTNQHTESRWPQYSQRAAEAGIGSSISVPLLVNDRHVAALNIYGAEPDAFSREAITAAESLAVYAAIILANADLYYTRASLAEQMTEAMASRAIIEQAKGVLMSSRRCDADEAFAILVKLSQQSHRKLREVAQALVDQITADSRLASQP